MNIKVYVSITEYVRIVNPLYIRDIVFRNRKLHNAWNKISSTGT